MRYLLQGICLCRGSIELLKRFKHFKVLIGTFL